MMISSVAPGHPTPGVVPVHCRKQKASRFSAQIRAARRIFGKPSVIARYQIGE